MQNKRDVNKNCETRLLLARTADRAMRGASSGDDSTCHP